MLKINLKFFLFNLWKTNYIIKNKLICNKNIIYFLKNLFLHFISLKSSIKQNLMDENYHGSTTIVKVLLQNYYHCIYKITFTFILFVKIGELKLNYLQKVYMVTMQTYQMAILLLFENEDVFKLTEIHELLQLDSDQFKKHINSLIECKLLLVDGDVCYLIILLLSISFVLKKNLLSNVYVVINRLYL